MEQPLDVSHGARIRIIPCLTEDGGLLFGSEASETLIYDEMLQIPSKGGGSLGRLQTGDQQSSIALRELSEVGIAGEVSQTLDLRFGWGETSGGGVTIGPGDPPMPGDLESPPILS